MTKTEIKALIDKYQNGQASAEERGLLESWYNQDARRPKEMDFPEDLWQRQEASLAAILGDSKTSIPMWPKLVGIAAAVALLVFGIWFYSQVATSPKPGNELAYQNDITAGKNGATLTLANGKKIKLDDAANGELAQEAGVSITKSDKGELIYQIKESNGEANRYNTLSTANGETYRVRLPDGSQVWLNSASSLKYPANFNNQNERRVDLTGEGYFEVAKDKNHPFIVQTSSQEVEVLGTHFNVNSYSDEPVVTTTLVEGSVKVKNKNIEKTLRPGEQSMNSGKNIKVAKADLETNIDWKNNEFYLEKMDFRVAMRKIARWYNVEVIYSGTVPENLEAGGWIQRSRNLSDVLKAIESTGLAHFKIEGRRLYVNE